MIEKPDLADEKIITGLEAGYAIHAARIKFLPLGNDASGWVYRISGSDEANYFLKVKKGAVYGPSLTMPRWLVDQGIPEVVAPLMTRTGELIWPVGEFELILYPFIAGRTGMEQGLTDEQWTAFGRVLRKIHDSPLTAHRLPPVHRETFVSKWGEMVKRLQARIWEDEISQPLEQELAAFWKEKDAEIRKIVDRTEELGRMLQNTPLEFVLCHTDIHTANILIDPDSHLHIVDWDQPLLAPKERDLMFVIGMPDESGKVESKEQRLFFEGYGEARINPTALLYYRYEWVVQEMGDFGERMFLAPELGEETKKASVQGFRNLFQSGDVVACAYQLDRAYLLPKE